MRKSTEKYSVTIGKVRTSISLEPPFWRLLNRIAQTNKIKMCELLLMISEDRREDQGLSSAIRVFVVKKLEASL